MKVLSLFSGIGAYEKALTRQGIKHDVVAYSEIDKYASKIYSTIHEIPEKLNLGDATKIDEKSLPDFELLVGGFPCQSFSHAGKRLGFAESRGTLFFEIARIAKHKQPKYMVLENVKGLMTHDKGKTLDTIVHTLNEIGYLVDFDLLNSKHFGVPQSRDRIYIICVRKDLAAQEEWIIPKKKNVINQTKERLQENGIESFVFPFPKETEVTKKLKDILETNVDDKFFIPIQRIKGAVAKENYIQWDSSGKEYNSQQDRAFYNEKVTGTISTNGNANVIEDSIDTLIKQLNDETFLVREATQKGYAEAHEGDSISMGVIPSKTRRGRVGKEIVKTLTTKDENAVVVPKWIPDGEGINRTLRTGGHGTMTNKHNFDAVYQGCKIRRLTPKECYRLQGFDDSDLDKAKAIGISDRQLYKTAGNSITVNVLESIFARLFGETP